MDAEAQNHCTAFNGARCIASGELAEVAVKAKAAVDKGEQVLIFDDTTSESIELDFRGSSEDVLRRLGRPDSREATAVSGAARGPGRPKLGVVAREVTLLPRHWEWLNAQPGGASVALRKLVEEHFQKERQLAFYADKLAMTVDRLNDHVRRATGVTAGHLIRQRVLTEAKRQLVFTSQPIHEIAYDLAFSDPSHFARFFRKQTGTTPHEFRAARGG